jgi:pimeloyl-ACP methyl ester carboxylesterase
MNITTMRAGSGSCASLGRPTTSARPKGREERRERRERSHVTAASSLPEAAVGMEEREIRPGTLEGYVSFRGHKVRYHRAAETAEDDGRRKPPVLLIHGFGGNADHFRKNIAELAKAGNRVYALDLLGYGRSDKPSPSKISTNTLYNFDTWSDQVLEFAESISREDEKVLICCNSVGGIAGLEAAIKQPNKVASVMLMNVSLRMLHEKKQSEFARPFVAALQKTLRTTKLGPWFFSQIATPQGVKNVLRQCYHDASAVTDELVECILQPGLEPNAVNVFLDFISYSTGPLPEEQLAACSVPTSILWGVHDPWEKVEWGRALAAYPCVEEFVEVEAGHCPMDEAPGMVNPLIAAWMSRYD